MIDAQKKIIEWCETLSEKIAESSLTGGMAEKITALVNGAREQQLVVPVVGSFSAGKSSMINSLLGDNILPVDITPETSLATELHFSPAEFIEAVKSNGEIDKYKVEEIAKVTENAAKYQYARLYLNNNRLREIQPLVLVDMPGFDSPLDLHSKAILEYLDRGCFYIVLSSVEEGTIVKTLERRLKEIEGWGREFAFFLSKANLRPKESLDQLTEHYKEQLETNFDSPSKVVRLETNSGDKVMQCLKNMDINRVFVMLYRESVLDVCDDVISAVNLQITASKKDASSLKQAIEEMEACIEKLSKEAAEELKEMRRRYSGSLTNEVIADVSKAFDGALEELVGIAATGNQEETKRTLNDIVRSALSVSFKEKLEGLCREISVDFSQSLGGLDKVMKDIDLNGNFLKDITEKVRNTLQVELLSKIPGGQETLNIGFKTIAGAGLAMSVINPIIGIVIMLLPEIIGGLMKLLGGDEKESQKEKIRAEFSVRVFPDIKRRLRAEIPAQIDGQIDLMIKEAGEKYKEQIEKQSEIIRAQMAEKSVNKEEAEAKQKRLEAIRIDVQKLASEIGAWGK